MLLLLIAVAVHHALQRHGLQHGLRGVQSSSSSDLRRPQPTQHLPQQPPPPADRARTGPQLHVRRLLHGPLGLTARAVPLQLHQQQ